MKDYTSVTEMPGTPLTQEAVAMIQSRYAVAHTFSSGKDVLEVGCGPGQGLWYLGEHTKRIVAGDIASQMVRYAVLQSPGSVAQFDAQALPFANNSFDVVLMFEMIYYLQDIRRAFWECRRVLRPAGTLVISTVNKEWSGFNPSRHSVKYSSATELHQVLTSLGFNVNLIGSFTEGENKQRQAWVRVIRRAAARFHLIPSTMKAKVFLKRLAYGKLTPSPSHLDPTKGVILSFTPLAVGLNEQYKVIYAIATKGGANARSMAESI